jgi:hypothetical protein
MGLTLHLHLVEVLSDPITYLLPPPFMGLTLHLHPVEVLFDEFNHFVRMEQHLLLLQLP